LETWILISTFINNLIYAVKTLWSLNLKIKITLRFTNLTVYWKVQVADYKHFELLRSIGKSFQSYYYFIYLLTFDFYERVLLAIQGALELTMQPRMALNSKSSCFCLPSAKITDISPLTGHIVDLYQNYWYCNTN
jgi:hypothetical protein